jgi:uncharacterized protein YciI
VQFLLMARDRPGPEGLARRDELRAAHAESISARFRAGDVLFGAGIYDDEGVVIGSVIILDMASRAAVDEYLATEPFHTGELWTDVAVDELKVPDMYLERMRPR